MTFFMLKFLFNTQKCFIKFYICFLTAGSIFCDIHTNFDVSLIFMRFNPKFMPGQASHKLPIEISCFVHDFS